ncbi:hypothetical protein PQE66_gp027 [Bacillus phage PBC2]|uniref:Uncharacterized protein n=1 Tax=Bacillus phage PBC2 TaxID=1675029 RepID=A0A218KBS6_9CAUD|nr:hypothetical protein PQE66_gp027 [Bacillus phage PBC2]AKQ08342.1 hypothetical protein PBC2_027 [Bacillus phage PBC2]
MWTWIFIGGFIALIIVLILSGMEHGSGSGGSSRGGSSSSGSSYDYGDDDDW